MWNLWSSALSSTKMEAEIARGALKAANIESMVSADDAGGNGQVFG
jgi:hypothetical protein